MCTSTQHSRNILAAFNFFTCQFLYSFLILSLEMVCVTVLFKVISEPIKILYRTQLRAMKPQKGKLIVVRLQQFSWRS